MKVEFVNHKIPHLTAWESGVREPLYGDESNRTDETNIIGFIEPGNSKAETRVVVVRGKEKQLRKHHKEVYEQVQEWLDKSETRTLELTMSRRAWKHIEDFSNENKLTLVAAIEEAVLHIE